MLFWLQTKRQTCEIALPGGGQTPRGQRAQSTAAALPYNAPVDNSRGRRAEDVWCPEDQPPLSGDSEKGEQPEMRGDRRKIESPNEPMSIVHFFILVCLYLSSSNIKKTLENRGFCFYSPRKRKAVHSCQRGDWPQPAGRCGADCAGSRRPDSSHRLDRPAGGRGPGVQGVGDVRPPQHLGG